MGKRRKQATLEVAPTGRVKLSKNKARRSDHREERSPSPATQARLERALKAQRRSQKYNKPTWRDELEEGRIIDQGEAVTSSSEDDDPALVDTVELVDDEAEEASDDEESSEGEEGHEQAAVAAAQQLSDGDSDADSDFEEQPTPRQSLKKARRAREIVLSSSDDEKEEGPAPVASTSSAKAVPAATAKNGRKPDAAKRRSPMLVFDGLDIDETPPQKRRTTPSENGKKATTPPASTSKSKAKAKAHPAKIEEDLDEELMSIALGNPQDTAEESDEEQPVQRLGSSARKRPRLSSSSEASSSNGKASTSDTSGDDDDDGLPVPATVASANKRLKAKREATLNNAALRSPRKTKSGRVRKVDTKRKLTALSQGVRDRRSDDDESEEEDFVVDDNDDIIYDTPTDEDGEERATVSKDKKRKGSRKGKERAISDEEDGNVDEAVASKKKKAGKAKSRKRVQRELLATDSDNDDEQPSRSASKRKKGKGKGKAKRAVQSESEEEALSRQRKKRRKRRRSSDSSAAEDDQVDDEPEDLEILDEQTVFDQKFRTIKTNEGKFASLKAARDRRKASQKAIVLDSEDESPVPTQHRSQRTKATASQPRFLGDPDHNSDEEDESDSDSDDSDRSGSGSSSSEDQSDGQGSIDDFLAEDDGNDEEVARYRAKMQLKSQGMRYYYKTYIILLVYMIIDPDRDWRAEDEDLRTADSKVTQELEGLLNSLVGSSAWKPKFKRIIDSRPELTVDPLGADEAGGPCEVCSMGRSRHASSVLTLSGPKYNRMTLRDLVSGQDSSAEEESDSEDENAHRKSRDKYYTFNSGGSCTNRAESYHLLRHWAHSTRDRVADMLAPIRRNIAEVDTTGMSKAARRAANQEVIERKHNEASRLIKILETGREVDNLADKLQREINQACSVFTVNN
ncbi:hypothetical protein JCM10908_006044 [Rhodotorula pacifica]|uniref:uncharacterized protein n=1 Tax=Rhodotorula pacifica TaxID=1495444 RepID=UPI00317D430C